MRTIRLIVAFLAGIALTTFAAFNWVDVSVRVWTGMPVVLPLPVVIAVAVCLGAVPVWVWGSASHWNLRRKLARAERALGVERDGAAVGTGGAIDVSAGMRPVPASSEA